MNKPMFRTAALMLVAAVVLSVFGGCSAPPGKKGGSKFAGSHGSDQDKQVRALVIEYMDNLKNKNVKGLVDMANLKAKDQVKQQLVMVIEKILSEGVNLEMKDYKIKKVKVDGGLALVTVEETTKVDPRSSRIPADFNKDFRTADTEIVLIKRDGKWKIDAMNTIHLSTLDITDDKMMQEQLNKYGAARAFTLLVDPDTANLALVGAAFATPMLLKAQGSGQLTACKSNLKNMGVALEMWSTDNKGHYPKSLKELTPDYLKFVPSCPAAGKDTYSISYKVSRDPDVFTMYCSGHYHKGQGIPEDHPVYSSIKGLITK